MKGLIEEIRKLGNIILVIDEVHNIVGAGDAEDVYKRQEMSWRPWVWAYPR